MSQPREQDAELASWTADWQTSTPREASERGEAAWARLRRQAERRGLGLRLALVAEVLLAGAGILVVAKLASHLGRVIDLAFAAALSLFFLGLLAYALWNRRGIWSATSASVNAYLELSLRRCERRLRTLRWLGWMVAVELALLVSWLWSEMNARGAAREEYWALYGLSAAVLLAVGLGASAVARHSRLEKARLLALRDELRGPESGDPSAWDLVVG